MSKSLLKIALIGNPNTGKTSLFNKLTGLNQQTGNYPGVTVDRKLGYTQLTDGQKAAVLDLPGTYSLNASSLDESVVTDLLLNPADKDYPDVIVVVTEVENLKRNLLLFTQIKDLQLPVVLAINMADRMQKRGISLDIPALETALDTKIALISSRKNTGIKELKTLIADRNKLSRNPIIDIRTVDENFFKSVEQTAPSRNVYESWLFLSSEHYKLNDQATDPKQLSVTASDLKRLQQKEVIKRYQFINNVLKSTQKTDLSLATDWRYKLDRIFTHRIFGYLIFAAILLLIFNAIFSWSSIPMDAIDAAFASLSEYTKSHMTPGMLQELLADGIIPGIGGIVIFIPQIAFLFLFISVLEESGYMSRVVFLMDRIMRRFGLSGKSVVPLISGTACAIPAIMAARNIENWKERLITILVTPFTTCSARLPVYSIIISLVIPNRIVLGFISMQALVLMGMYLIGFAMAILAATILNKIIKLKTKQYFVIEMPDYKWPLPQNIGITVVEKTKAFVMGAGKIILAISVILWFLASYGPGENMDQAGARVTMEQEYANGGTYEQAVAAARLEESYIGRLGRGIEPVIKPLGYDWKIGIAILTSFAAREVFVGTLATIYSVGGTEDEETIKQKMRAQTDIKTGKPIFDLGTGLSILMFYAFAMQCVSTLAITKRETNSCKWPLMQLAIMTVLAYCIAFIVHEIAS